MGYFTLKIAVVAALLLVALAAFPLGAIAALRRSRRSLATRSRCCLTGAAVAGLLLHREKLAGAVAVEIGPDPLREGYSPHAIRLDLSPETARSRSLAALAESAFAVARAARHADRDPDFIRAEQRARADRTLANLIPPLAALGLVLPELRGLALVVAPLLAVALAARTALALPSERRSAELALRLLRSADLLAPHETRPLAAHLQTRAARVLARPLLDCVWISWTL